jgi:crotonobetainyl-CoA:carnitine CoA-transferase CaiB-like acyl-CoA transferase
MPDPVHPNLRLVAAPVQFDDQLPAVRRSAPAQGEHTTEVLAELGYGSDEIDALFADGVVAGPNRNGE